MKLFAANFRAFLAVLFFGAAGLAPALAVTFYDQLQSYPSTQGVAPQNGQLGEVQSINVPVGSAVTYTVTATSYNLGSLTLTPGQWSCQASVVTTAAGTTFVSAIVAFNTVSATLPTAPAGGYSQANLGGSTGVGGLQSGVYNVTVATVTTLYVVSQAAFTGTAPTFYGSANCLRIR
jgi:hypothetical protein